MFPQKQTPIKRDTHKHSKTKIPQIPEPVIQPYSQPISSHSPKPTRPLRSYSEEATKREHFIQTRYFSAFPTKTSYPRTVTVERICNIDALAVQSKLTHPQKKALSPLLKLKLVDRKEVENPENFPDAPMVTTFVHSVVGQVTKVWRMLRRAKQAGSIHPWNK